MAGDLYLAVDEPPRDTSTAGLQAGKDKQPLDTTLSCTVKQREWKARLPPPLPTYCTMSMCQPLLIAHDVFAVF